MSPQNVSDSTVWVHENDPNKKNYNNHLEGLRVIDGMPVLIRSVGQYPVAVNDKGETTRNKPHFILTYSESSKVGQGKYATLHLDGFAGHRQSGHPAMLTAWSKRFDEGVDDLKPWIDEALKHVDLRFIDSIIAQYDEADRRFQEAYAYPCKLSRAEYEQSCQELGVQAFTDEYCLKGWGDFRFPQYSNEVVVAQVLAGRRRNGIKGELEQAMDSTAPAPKLSVPKPNGQLWEPCEICGKEPVYMPLHKCMDCWPTDH
ncbi:hypothetical protein ACT3UJ_06685 [Halomonas sp. 86]|uniref:hypothetical protein n=1 Tax=unclassified Halomonas TaxID=2609666 RepID=UPI004033A59D